MQYCGIEHSALRLALGPADGILEHEFLMQIKGQKWKYERTFWRAYLNFLSVTSRLNFLEKMTNFCETNRTIANLMSFDL